MKPFFEHWPEIVARLQRAPLVFLALDYDGVLSPIARTPALAELSAANRSLLERLVKAPRLRVAVISGRSLADIRARINVPSIIYAGNHGSEIDLNGTVEAHAGAGSYREPLSQICQQLTDQFSAFSGVFVEDKGFGIGLHYREVAPSRLDFFHRQFTEWSKNLPAGLHVVHAKKMYEIRPVTAWHKGDAVDHIWQAVAPGALPICLGDDLTDEDGFRALRGLGITVYVGEERQSYAEYILPSTADVTTFLARLVDELNPP